VTFVAGGKFIQSGDPPRFGLLAALDQIAAG
jgi:hypothetical protein